MGKINTSSFLSGLGGIINDQFGIGESTSHSINSLSGGAFGEPSEKIDQSAERYYMEDGFIRDIRPRSRSILFQQPDIYVVIKKRMFSTLQDNIRLDLLEEKERILVAATKRLFQNKTRILAAYEKLTKIEDLTFEAQRFNTFLGPQLLNLLDSGDLLNVFNLSGETKAALDKLRKVLSYSEPGKYSNWSTNNYDAVFGKDIGEGPGTFELTNVSSLKTSVSTEWGSGSANLTIEDPYNLLTITSKDIDQALTDVTNPMSTGSFFKFTDIELQNRISELQSELAIERRNRLASNITFKVSAGTVLSKRVRAILDDEGIEIVFQYSTGAQDAFNDFADDTNFFDVASSVGGFFSSGSVQIEPRFLAGNDSLGSVSSTNQLTRSERQKFTEIISNVFTLLSQRQTSRRELKARNAEINYARNRMMLFFNGKFVIQPMDTVTIWMTSRTGEDDRLPGGFQKQHNEQGFGIVQKFDNIIKNIGNQLSSLKTNTFGRVTFEDIERISTVGPDMPMWLWRQFKQDITNQPTGPCIFSGIVGKGQQGPSGSWSDGKWTISIPCEDNTGYFDKSQINFKPAADVFNSSIYDPLTPFDVSFDAATGVPITELSGGDFPPLLPENEKLLQSGLLTYRSGKNKGSTATEENWKVPAKELSFDTFKAVLHDPEGMVYRWKQGIQTLTKTGRPNPQVSVDQERAVLLTNQPFAGQDIMNVVSLLITGQPYNYDTFLKSAIANGNSLGRKDDLTNLPAAETYIQGLINDIEKNNLIWGNFIPYKKLTVNSNLEKFISERRLDLVTQSAKLQAKLRERAKAEDELALMFGGFSANGAFSRDSQGNPTIPSAGSTIGDVQGTGALADKIKSLSTEIYNEQLLFDQTIKDPIFSNPDVGLTLIGNDIIANPTLSPIDDAKSTPAQKQRDELQLRQRIARFTARRFWQVRANDDQNLFIVDDQYDKNLDIMAFERRIGGKIELFNSEYTNIGDKVNTVKQLLGLECFANTQGHIEIRPPLYNRMPSSVFYKMFQDRDATGVKVFPDFLENLFFNQIRGIFSQIEIIEDEIRLRAMALGAKDDNDILGLIKSEGFSFLTSEDGDGRIGTKPLQKLLAQSNPDFAEGWDDPKLQSNLKELGDLGQQVSKATKIERLFNPADQVSAISFFHPSVNIGNQAGIAEKIRTRLRIKTGREPKKVTELFGNPRFQRGISIPSGGDVSRIDRINVVRQIADFLSERQNLLKTLSNAIKNLQEGVNINAPDVQNDNIFQGGAQNLFKSLGGKASANKAATTPFLNRKTEIPQFLEHMIEDEDEDDIGPMSGRRFVLTPDRIVSITISENPPPYTMITVNGLFGEGFVNNPANLKTSSDGNAITSAYAVDYDMWYQYGLRVARAIEAPFLSDPDVQCAPFAVATLLEARENILRGSVEVAGYNEYYQPGDVVYIEERNLLFYVKSVGHSFSYGNLSTTLDLTYGHTPGVYIPTMLDTVGKILYNAQGFGGSYRSERQQRLGSARSLGALGFVSNSYPADDGSSARFKVGTDPLELLLRGGFGERNKSILSNVLFSVSGSLNQVSFRRQKAVIKIVYYKTSTSFSSEMFELAEDVRSWLLFPEGNTPTGLSPLKLSKESAQPKTFGLNEDDVIIEEVDMSDSMAQTRRIVLPTSKQTQPVKNIQGPSNAAVALAREVDLSGLDGTGFKELLANTALDIFIEYVLVRNPTTSLTDGVSQADQAANATVDAVRNTRGS